MQELREGLETARRCAHADDRESALGRMALPRPLGSRPELARPWSVASVPRVPCSSSRRPLRSAVCVAPHLVRRAGAEGSRSREHVLTLRHRQLKACPRGVNRDFALKPRPFAMVFRTRGRTIGRGAREYVAGGRPTAYRRTPDTRLRPYSAMRSERAGIFIATVPLRRESACQYPRTLASVDSGSPRFAPESSVARVREVDLHWAEVGRGRPLVLLHGLGDSHRRWFLVAPPLALKARPHGVAQWMRRFPSCRAVR